MVERTKSIALESTKSRHCIARRSNGEQCGRYAIKGGNVCTTHGGAAPQVREAAQRRLAALVEPAIAVLTELMRKADTDTVRLNAAKDILNRVGIAEVSKVEHDGKIEIEVTYGGRVESEDSD